MTMKEIKIGTKVLRKGSLDLPYFIAEAGVNHEGNMAYAKQMIEEVAKAGGNAIKFQVYKAETLASKNSPAYWDLSKEKTPSQYTLFKKYDKFWKKEFEELSDYAQYYKLDFTATPFDIESADFLEPLIPYYKVASSDITNMPFLKYIARKKKPILLSTGASNLSEIWAAIEWIKQEHNDQILLFHCILNYPTDYKNANLGMIGDMYNIFDNFIIGYSDHTSALQVNDSLTTAWLLGAQVIEKHYTWNKTLPGNDHYHSMDYFDLKGFVDHLHFIKELIGASEKNPTPSESPSRAYARRSLVASKKIPKGKKIEISDLTWKRPGVGIPPFMIDYVVGGEALVDISADEVLSFEKIKLNSCA